MLSPAILWGKSGRTINITASLPQLLCLTARSSSEMLFPTFPSNPKFPIDITLGQGAASDTGILNISSPDAPLIELHY